MNYFNAEATNKLQNYLLKWNHKFSTGKYSCDHSCCINEDVTTDTDKIRILEELCQQGAHLNFLEQERGFALIPNVFYSEKLIRFFVDKGMDVNSKLESARNNTALHLALNHAYLRPEDFNGSTDAIKYLWEHTSPDVTNSRGETPMFTLADCELHNPESEWTAKLAKMMWLEMDEASTNQQATTTSSCDEKEGIKIIDKASIRPRIIDEFIGLKESTEVRTYSWGGGCSKTPLMSIASEGNLEYCRILIEEKGAFVNAMDLQGYTALHHSVLCHANKCAKFLVKKGADPNWRSTVTGRDSYDLSILNYYFDDNYNRVFTFRATPAKKAQIFELMGAMLILKHNRLSAAIGKWKKAWKIYKKLQVLQQPSPEFVANYKFLRQNAKNSEAREEIRLSAMKTVARLSHQGNNKFWNLLTSFSPNFDMDDVFRFLDFILSSEEFKRPELDRVSFDDVDFKSLLDLILVLNDWLLAILRSKISGVDITIKQERISQVHSIAKLVIACFEKLMRVTKNKMASDLCSDVYVAICFGLTLLHTKLADAISEMAFKNNKILLQKLVDLDLRDAGSNSLMHLALIEYMYRFTSDMIEALIIDFGSEVRTKNRMGFEPVQCVKDWDVVTSDELLAEMADRGAHVDARSAITWNGRPTLRDEFQNRNSNVTSFRYDSLQCACARFLARNLVPYRNRVPKNIVDFIQEHAQ